MTQQVRIPVFTGTDLGQLIRWARDTTNRLNDALRKLDLAGTIFGWDEGSLTVPISTTISGSEVITFDCPFVGNGALIVTGVGFEGGVHVALNDTDLGSLSDGDTSSEILYEIQVTNLINGLNTFKIWSTTTDAGELRRLEVWRNFTREYIDTGDAP